MTTAEKLIEQVELWYPDLPEVFARVKNRVPWIKRQIQPHEGALLYALAKWYNRPGCRILEIGTAWGYSAAMIAEGAPQAEIYTLNPKLHEYQRAVDHLRDYGNVMLLNVTSMEFFNTSDGLWDMIFVDGDHTKVEEDFLWWNVLRPEGLMLFHDWSPEGSDRPCRQVYEAVNRFGEWLGRESDWSVMTDELIGMVGFIKHRDDPNWSEFWP